MGGNKLHPHPPQKGLRDRGLSKLPPYGNFGTSIPPPKKTKTTRLHFIRCQEVLGPLTFVIQNTNNFSNIVTFL
jgi:hypothetical protein